MVTHKNNSLLGVVSELLNSLTILFRYMTKEVF